MPVHFFNHLMDIYVWLNSGVCDFGKKINKNEDKIDLCFFTFRIIL